MQTAISNAKDLNKSHKKNGTELISIDSNPSSQVMELVQNILLFIKKNKPFEYKGGSKLIDRGDCTD